MLLVTGGTGLTGGELVRRLAALNLPVRVLVRNAAKAAGLAALPGVEVAAGDMARPETLAGPLRGVERAMLISSSAPDMLEVQSNFIAAAAQAGVRHVVKLSGGIPGLDSPFRFARMHAAAERRLEASGMAFTHLRPGEFMETYFRSAPAIVAKGLLLRPMGQARIASIAVADIAAAAAAVLTGSGHEGKTYPLTGPEALTMAEVAGKLCAATGRIVRYIDVPPEEAKRAGMAAGMPAYTADALDELFAERRKGAEARVWSTLHDTFGIRATPFDEFARRHAAIFRGELPAPRV